MTIRRAGAAPASSMVGKCAWCGRVRSLAGDWSPEIGGDGRAAKEVSHTICPECFAQVLAEARR